MQLSKRLIMILALSAITLASTMQAAPPKKHSSRDKKTRITYSSIKEEQRIIRSFARDATNDLEQAGKGFERAMYNLSWLYVTESGMKLDSAHQKMKGQAQRIEVAKNSTFGFSLPERDRKILRDAYYKLKTELNMANQKLNAVEKDVGDKLGIDVGVYRQRLFILKQLCEQLDDPALCRGYAALKAAINSGNVKQAKKVWSKYSVGVKEAVDEDPSLNEFLPEEIEGNLDDITSQDEGEIGVAPVTTPSISGPATGPGVSLPMDNVPSATMGMPQVVDLDPANGEIVDDPNTPPNKIAVRGSDGIVRYYDIVDDPNTPAGMIAVQDPDGNVHYLKPGNVVDDPNTPAGMIAVRDPATGETLFVYPNGENVIPAYIGAKGTRLKEESKIIAGFKPNPSAEGGFDMVKKDTASRPWKLSIKVSNRVKESGGVRYIFEVVDRAGNVGMEIQGWEIFSPDGSLLISGEGSTQEALFTASGNYKIVASGITDWGSVFKITQQVRESL